MPGNLWRESGLAIVLIALAILLVNPMELWMPDMAAMTLAAALFLVFIAFAALVWRESAGDERDALHKAVAGRFGYLAGVLGLTVGIIAQSFRHAVDPWLVVALVVMVLAKLGSRAWSARKN